jgi:hypothetical protein
MSVAGGEGSKDRANAQKRGRGAMKLPTIPAKTVRTPLSLTKDVTVIPIPSGMSLEKLCKVRRSEHRRQNGRLG